VKLRLEFNQLTQHAKGRTHDALNANRPRVLRRANALERPARLAFTEPQASQRLKGLHMGSGQLRVDRRPIPTSVSMPKAKPGRNTALDEQPSLMLRAVVRRAQHDHPIFVVVSSFGAKDDVVDVDERSVATPGYDAAPAVATEDLAAEGRRNVLMSTRCPHVGRIVHRSAPDLLRIAARHLDDLGVERHLFPFPLLPTSAASLADGERHLIARTAFFRGTAENVPCHEEQGCIVVERFSSVLS
jgi:hypothetical protein